MQGTLEVTKHPDIGLVKAALALDMVKQAFS